MFNRNNFVKLTNSYSNAIDMVLSQNINFQFIIQKYNFVKKYLCQINNNKVHFDIEY